MKDFKNFDLDMKLFLTYPYKLHTIKFNTPLNDQYMERLKIKSKTMKNLSYF